MADKTRRTYGTVPTVSVNRGATAPSNPFEGMLWWDTSGDPLEVLKRYTVTAGWVSLMTVNITTGAYTLSGVIANTLVTTQGDIIYASSANTPARLAKGTAYQHLGMSSGATVPEWQESANSVLTAQGDLLYADGANSLARLAKGTARQQLAMNSGATAPEWVASLQSLLTTQGDIMYASSANTPARLAKGTAYQHLGMNSGATVPEWQASATSVLTTQGDLLYASAANTLARLAKGTARYNLAMNSGATAPEWVASLQSLMTAQGDIVYASGANTPARLAKGTAGQVLHMNSGATAPEWVGMAAASDINTGTDTVKPLSADALAGSNLGTKTVIIKCIADDTALSVGDGLATFVIPVELNGMNLVSVGAHVFTASSSGTPTIQIHNLTDTQDMLSTRITIDANEKDSKDATTAAVINTSYDDVATGDEIRIDVDVAGTGTAGLEVRMGFRLP